jgi:putative transposase
LLTVPFASAHALFHLSKLAVWWLRLGIGIERIKPGNPQQNGRHERMHLTLKKERLPSRPVRTSYSSRPGSTNSSRSLIMSALTKPSA